jgi:hypothetical protein
LDFKDFKKFMIWGSIENTLFNNVLGELIVAGKRGLIGETISMVSICLPFPQGRANLRRFPSGNL